MRSFALVLAAASRSPRRSGGGGASGQPPRTNRNRLRSGCRWSSRSNWDGKPDIIALAQMPGACARVGWQTYVGQRRVASHQRAGRHRCDGIPRSRRARLFDVAQDQQGQIGFADARPDMRAMDLRKSIQPTAHRIRWIDADSSGENAGDGAAIGRTDAARLQGADVDSFTAPDWKREASPMRSPARARHRARRGTAEGDLLGAASRSQPARFANARTQTELRRRPATVAEAARATSSSPARRSSSDDRTVARHGRFTGRRAARGPTADRRPIMDAHDHHPRHRRRRPREVSSVSAAARTPMLTAPPTARAGRRALDDEGMAAAGCAAADLNADKRVTSSPSARRLEPEVVKTSGRAVGGAGGWPGG